MKKRNRKLLSGVLSLAMALSLIASPPGTEGNVVQAEEVNLITGGDFENSWVGTNDTDAWKVDTWPAIDTLSASSDNAHTGAQSLNFYSASDVDEFLAYQTLPNLEAGTYAFTMYVYGGGTGEVYGYLDGEKTDNALSVDGVNDGFIEVTKNFTITETKNVKVGFSIKLSSGAWGYIDDISLVKVENSENLFKNESAADWTLNPTDGTLLSYEDGNLTLEQGDTGADITLTQNITLEADAAYTCSVNASSESSGIWMNAYNGTKWNDPNGEVSTTDGLSLTFKPGDSGDIGWAIWMPAGATLTLSDISLTKDSSSNVDPATALKDAVEACQSLNLNKDEYTEKSWTKYTQALEAAKATLADLENADDDTILAQVKTLKQARNSLKEAIFVKKVENLSDDFIRGVDISSYVSIKDSGATFKDEDGNVLSDEEFFTLLKNSGINYVRVKIWNDPYTYVDADKNEYPVDEVQGSGNSLYVEASDGSQTPVTRYGYGGGNSDIEKAITIGQLATAADMKVLIDFHYSDFWADPARQHAPKAWKNMTLEQKQTALYTYTKESLQQIVNAGVDVGMVQVGNETNNGIAGEYRSTVGWEGMCKLFREGCKAVKEVSSDIMTAVHFTDPQTPNNYNEIAKALDDNNVDYDVFASSYYPNIHGSMENITKVLNDVAVTYNKKVMVAETAWAWTDTKDGDGHNNTFSAPANSDYSVSVQGQANVIRDVVQAVVDIENQAGIGVFYWEPAWIPVQYVYDEDGNYIKSIYNSNQEKWEAYGSGWASSYAALSYDTDEVGTWYGGSVKDNESFFDFHGEPLSSLTVFKDIYTGKEGKIFKLDVVKQGNVELTFNDIQSNLKEIKAALPETVVGIYNNSERKNLPVQWNTDEVDNITDFGTYTITGKAVDEMASSTVDATCTLTILPDSILKNGDFESGSEDWTVDNPSNAELKWDDTPLRGEGALHFYNSSEVNFSIEQTAVVQKAGKYIASMYLQGDGGNENENIKISVTNKTQQLESEGGSVNFAGWANWQKATTSSVAAKKGDELTVRVSFQAPAGAWGSIDDVFLYATELDPAVPASSISLNVTEKTLEVGATLALTATIEPEDVTDAGVTWSSSDETIAAVTEEGIVTAIAAGTATITVATTDGSELKATCNITVITKSDGSSDITSPTPGPAGNNTPAPSPSGNATTAALSAQTITGKNKYTKTYGDKAFNLNAKAPGTLTYTSGNKTVATVSGTGKVTIKGTGVAVITVKAAPTEQYQAATKKITITVKPKKINGVKVKASSKKLTVTWKKTAKAAGYQIQYSTSKKFKGAKTKTASSTAKSKTIKKLKAKKIYYVRIRAYAKNGKKKIPGAYSKTVKIRVK